jgi:hypothetical protein
LNELPWAARTRINAPNARASAANGLLDRGYGKPAQTMSNTIVRDELSDAELFTDYLRLMSARSLTQAAIRLLEHVDTAF